MATYTGESIKDLTVTDPVEDNTPPPELNDCEREIKRVLKNQYAVTALTSNTTLTSAHHYLLCNATGGAFAVTLPAVATVSSATFLKEYIIQKSYADATANAVTITGTVSGVVNPTLVATGDAISIIGNGSVWIRLQSIVATMSGGTIDGGTIGGTTAPTIYGKMPIITSAGSVSLTAAQCYGTYVKVTATGTVSLPAMVAGMNLIIRTATANEVLADPNGTEAFILNGTTLTNGYRLTTSSTGNDLALVSDGTNWLVTGYSTWTNKGS
jgi:hypothetical protein